MHLSGAHEAVTALVEEYRLGIVTNGAPEMQAQKSVVHAGYDAPAKPGPEPFRQILSVLDGTPESAVHIGNSLVSDVAGAQTAGITAVWLDDGSDSDPVPDYTLSSMEELENPPWPSS